MYSENQKKTRLLNRWFAVTLLALAAVAAATFYGCGAASSSKDSGGVNLGTVIPGGTGTGTGIGYSTGTGYPTGSSDNLVIRNYFPETLYSNSCVITGTDGRARLEIPMADSITSWRMSTVANSKSGGLGHSTTAIRVFQDFFIDINLPVSITRGDEISIPLVLYNYSGGVLDVDLTLAAGGWFTSLGATSMDVSLNSNEVRAVYFPIKALDVGVHSLLFTAVSDNASDGISRTIRVVPDGNAVTETVSGYLEPSLNATFNVPADAIENATLCHVKICPTLMTPVVEGMESLLRRPYG